MTSTLSTTPTMIWLTTYLMENSTSNAPTSAPAMGAAIRPAYADDVIDATTAARNAPARSCPSIATLMMPERSQSRPDSAPNTSGIARNSEPCRSPVSGIGESLPASAHTRNAITTQTPKIAGSQTPTLRRFFVST